MLLFPREKRHILLNWNCVTLISLLTFGKSPSAASWLENLTKTLPTVKNTIRGLMESFVWTSRFQGGRWSGEGVSVSEQVTQGVTHSWRTWETWHENNKEDTENNFLFDHYFWEAVRVGLRRFDEWRFKRERGLASDSSTVSFAYRFHWRLNPQMKGMPSLHAMENQGPPKHVWANGMVEEIVEVMVIEVVVHQLDH